jgi:hypothetical protein
LVPLVKDETSLFNEDIEAACGYSDSKDIEVFGFIE